MWPEKSGGKTRPICSAIRSDGGPGIGAYLAQCAYSPNRIFFWISYINCSVATNGNSGWFPETRLRTSTIGIPPRARRSRQRRNCSIWHNLPDRTEASISDINSPIGGHRYSFGTRKPCLQCGPIFSALGSSTSSNRSDHSFRRNFSDRVVFCVGHVKISLPVNSNSVWLIEPSCRTGSIGLTA